MFEPGNPGGGAPRGKRKPKPVTDALIDALARSPEEQGHYRPETTAEEVASTLVTLAVGRRNLGAIQTILNRVEGRAPLYVSVDHEHGIDDEVRAILAALGVPVAGAETRAETGPGQIESGGTGGGPFERELEACPALEAAESVPAEFHGLDRPAGESPALDLDASQAWEK